MLALLFAAGCHRSAPPVAEPTSGTLLPLVEYRAETLAGAQVLWHPEFAASSLRTQVHDAITEDLLQFASLEPELSARLGDVRIAVAASSPELEVLPACGRGLGYHRSSAWLVDHGFDAAREGVIEIYNARDFLEEREADPDVLGRQIAAVLDYVVDRPRTSGPAMPPLSQYVPEPVGGLVVLWNPDFAELDPALQLRVRTALTTDLAAIEARVPKAAMSRLAGTRIVVNRAAWAADGKRLHGAAAHRSAGWLTDHGLDAEREGTVEVHDASDYLGDREGAQPMVLLHELTHVLEQHADAPTLAALEAAFEAATRGDQYTAVRHVLEPPGRLMRAYALNNADEYGAELAEAWFGRNDWQPFDRTELLAFDPEGCAAAARLWFDECP